MKTRLAISGEQLSFWALLLFLSYSVIRTAAGFVGIDVNLVGYIVVILIYGLFALSLFTRKPKGFNTAVVIVLSILLLLFITMLIFPENGNVIGKGLALQRGVLVILFVCSIEDIRNIEKSITALAYLSIIEVGFGMISYFQSGGYWISIYHGAVKYGNYNMSVGYHATFAAIVLIQQYINDKKIYKLILFICMVFISIVFGSRGCILCYLVMMILLWQKIKTPKLKFLTIIIGLLVFFIVYIIGIGRILSGTIHMLQNMGLESRTLNGLVSSSLSLANSSGRDVLWETILNKTAERPILGYGVFGEQHFFEVLYGDVQSAHNIILELLVSFGIPLGTALFILLVHSCIKALKILRDTELEIGYIALLSYNTGNLMVSNTYWYSTNFWIMIGLIIIAIKRVNFEK